MAKYLPSAHQGKWSLVLAAGLSCLAGTSLANEALARKNDCLGCHSVSTKLVGPAFKDVAAVIDVMQQLDVAVPVARTTPLATMKG